MELGRAVDLLRTSAAWNNWGNAAAERSMELENAAVREMQHGSSRERVRNKWTTTQKTRMTLLPKIPYGLPRVRVAEPGQAVLLDVVNVFRVIVRHDARDLLEILKSL